MARPLNGEDVQNLLLSLGSGIDAIIFYWKNIVEQLLLTCEIEASREFWHLLGTGQVFQYSIGKEIFDSFKDVGLLHLLVLSGSQVGILVRVSRGMLRGVFRHAWMASAKGRLFERLGISSILVFYLCGTGFSPPLLRASMMHEVNTAGAFALKEEKVLLAFLFHAILFPGQFMGDSFVLSWGAFLLLIIFSRLNLSSWQLQLLLSVSCHLFVIELKDLPFPSLLMWMKILCANLLFISIFDWIIFPCVAILLVFSILLSLVAVVGGENSIFIQIGVRFFDSFSVIYDCIASVVLCSIRTIRYI